MDKENNIAFVDGQNLHLGTTKCVTCMNNLGIKIENFKKSACVCGGAWKVDLKKFRIYLQDKYSVNEAYYFLGNLQEENEYLYKQIQKAGFIVEFKERKSSSTSKKKGNVDSDIVFEIMRTYIEDNTIDNFILVSGDGDYKKVVNFLLGKGKFKKILHPNETFASSLYKKLGSEYYDYLENLRSYIE